MDSCLKLLAQVSVPICERAGLHTFCKACLLLHFGHGNATCPHCNVSLGHHPRAGIRADRTLETLVSKLFPHFKALARQDPFDKVVAPQRSVLVWIPHS